MHIFRFCILIPVLVSVSQAQDLEQRATELATQLREKPEAAEERLEWISELAKLSCEGREAVSVLKEIVEKTDPPEPLFFDDEAIAASRALLAMGDEALPAIRELLLHEREIVSDTMLRELSERPFLEGDALYEVLLEISEEDSIRPAREVMEAELKKALRGNLGGVQFPRKLTGSKSMNDYFRRVDRSRRAVNAILNTGENRDELQAVLLKRLYRKTNPVPWGIEAFPPNSRAILGLRKLALKGKDPESRILAARALVAADPGGKISVPVLIEQLDDDGAVGTADGQSTFMFLGCPLVSSEAISALRDHPARHTANPEKLLAATNRLIQGDERLEWKSQCQAWHLLAQCGADDAVGMLAIELLANSMRTPGFAAAPLLMLDRNSEETLDQLLKLLNDESKPVSPHTFGGMLPAPIPVRASVARALGFVAEKDRDRVLEELRRYLASTYIPRRGGDPKVSHLAAWAAWSIVRLDRHDEEALELLLALEPEQDAFSFSRRDLRSALFYESPESVAEVLGDRIKLVQDRLAVQAMARYEDTNYYVHEPSRDGRFAREILLTANPPQVGQLVAQAFRDLASEDYRKSSNAIAALLELRERKFLTSSFEAIRKELSSKSVQCRAIAAHLLGELQHAPPISIMALKEATADSRALVRTRAAQALAKFGSAASEALPQLRKMKSDTYESVRKAAESACARIDPVE